MYKRTFPRETADKTAIIAIKKVISGTPFKAPRFQVNRPRNADDNTRKRRRFGILTRNDLRQSSVHACSGTHMSVDCLHTLISGKTTRSSKQNPVLGQCPSDMVPLGTLGAFQGPSEHQHCPYFLCLKCMKHPCNPQIFFFSSSSCKSSVHPSRPRP